MLGGLAEPVGDSALPGDRQTDQIIEGLDQIHRALLAFILLGDLHSVGEGIGESLHVQQAAAALKIHHVVDHVILAQQRLELSAVVGKLDIGKGIFIALKPHILDNLGYTAIALLRFSVLPVRSIDNFLHTRLCNSIEVFAHFSQNVFAFSLILSVQKNYCMTGSSRSAKKIKYNALFIISYN